MPNLLVMSDPVQPLVTPAQYLLSNGTKVVSSVPVNFYTDNEILKIEIAGGIAIVAILVLAYVGYQYFTIRYAKWAAEKEIEEKLAAGIMVSPEEMPKLAPAVNKGLLYVVGGLVILAGIIVMILPS